MQLRVKVLRLETETFGSLKLTTRIGVDVEGRAGANDGINLISGLCHNHWSERRRGVN